MRNLIQVINDPGLARVEWEATPYTLSAGFVEVWAAVGARCDKNSASVTFSY